MFCTLLNLAKFYTAPIAEQLLTKLFDISTSLGQIANGAVQDMQIRVQNSRVLLYLLIIICLFSFFFGEGSVMLMMVMDDVWVHGLDVCLRCLLCVVFVVCVAFVVFVVFVVFV